MHTPKHQYFLFPFLFLILWTDLGQAKVPFISDVHQQAQFIMTSDWIQLMGPSIPTRLGDYEDQLDLGSPGYWYGVDLSAPTENHWLSALDGGNCFNMPVGNYAAVCGKQYSGGWGYGNDWYDILAWRQSPVDPMASTNISINFDLIMDSNPGKDILFLCRDCPGSCFPFIIQSWTGLNGSCGSPTHESIDLTIQPNQYCDGEIVLFFLFSSDYISSDEDAGFNSGGGCQLDNILVTGGSSPSFSDFGPGSMGDWVPIIPTERFGNFAKIWSNLCDVAKNGPNYTRQVAFLHDGLVQPCLPEGSSGLSWLYGPSGWVPNTTGGLALGSGNLHNGVASPVLTWPDAEHNGLAIRFDAYAHETLTYRLSPGIFYGWSVRSTASSNPENINLEKWKSDDFMYYGGPEYRNVTINASGYLVNSPKYVQVMLWAWDHPAYDGIWGGSDASPAPYFDNVRVSTFIDPSLWIDSLVGSLTFPNFVWVPKSGSSLPPDPSLMDVRFEMARNIAPPEDMSLDLGDSTVFTIKATGAGRSLEGAPVLRWSMKQNPLFDATLRTSEFGMATTGSMTGIQDVDDPDVWSFDLPDEDFLYMGDVLHYYIEATDSMGGQDLHTTTYPAELTGYGDFDNPMAYQARFVVRALPTVIAGPAKDEYSTPPILFWNDAGIEGGAAEWFTSFNNLGLVPGRDYDVFTTDNPGSAFGNGLASVFTTELLSNYDVICYSCGDQGRFTLCDGDYNFGGSNDIALLMSWLDTGDKHLFLTGNQLANDLSLLGAEAAIFLQDYMGLSCLEDDLPVHVEQQSFPSVILTTAGSSIFQNATEWTPVVFDDQVQTRDAVDVVGGAVRLAEYSDRNGESPPYDLAAGALNFPASTPTSEVISFPYDLMFVLGSGGNVPVDPVATRTMVLHDVLQYFGITANPQDASPVPHTLVFSVENHPNPFNPTTTIKYTMPTAGHLALKVFNLRGQLVRTLLDEHVTAGTGQITWNGRDEMGAEVASGAYFYKADGPTGSIVNKMLLLK